MKRTNKLIPLLLVVTIMLGMMSSSCTSKPSEDVSEQTSSQESVTNSVSGEVSSDSGEDLNPVSDTSSESALSNDMSDGSSTGVISKPISGVTSASVSYNTEEFPTLAKPNLSIIHTVSNDEYKALLKKGQTDPIWATVADFKIKYGGTVKVTVVPFGSLVDKTINLQNSGAAPDLLFLSDQNFPSTAVTKVVQAMEDLKDITGKKIDYRKKLWSELVMNSFKYGGKTYAIQGKSALPFISLIYYNETMFKQAGLVTPKSLYKQGKWSWDEFEKAARKLTKKTAGASTYDVLGFATWTMIPSLFTQSNNTAVVKLDSNGKYIANLNDSKVMNTLNFLYDAFQSADKGGYMDINAGLSFESDFPAGKVAMIYGNPPPATVKFDWDCVPFPYGPDNTTKKSPSQLFGYGIPTGSKNPEGALAFLYMLNDPKYTKPNVVSTVNLLSGYTNLKPDQAKGQWNYENYRNPFGAAKNVPTYVAMDRNFSEVWTLYWNICQDLAAGDKAATVSARYQPVLQASLEKSYGGR